VPVADPARVSDEIVAALKVEGATTWVALHANHARELTERARGACARLIDAGIPMVSQSVLLRGVNDNPAQLEALMRAFVESRIKPYYLHHGDLAPGTSHLRTTLEQGQQFMRSLRGRVSGLCQPEYVLDIPGGHGKVPVGPNYLAVNDAQGREQPLETRYRVLDYCGDVHLYPALAEDKRRE
jgi:lysine 2,3-aminomutase